MVDFTKEQIHYINERLLLEGYYKIVEYAGKTGAAVTERNKKFTDEQCSERWEELRDEARKL
jgi:hypothetical protein